LVLRYRAAGLVPRPGAGPSRSPPPLAVLLLLLLAAAVFSLRSVLRVQATPLALLHFASLRHASVVPHLQPSSSFRRGFPHFSHRSADQQARKSLTRRSPGRRSIQLPLDMSSPQSISNTSSEAEQQLPAISKDEEQEQPHESLSKQDQEEMERFQQLQHNPSRPRKLSLTRTAAIPRSTDPILASRVLSVPFLSFPIAFVLEDGAFSYTQGGWGKGRK
jgi:hypothetical protein